MNRTTTPALSSGEKLTQFLSFRLSGENYGIPIQSVREILEFVEPTIIPTMPPFMRGLISLRGIVVPIIDLQSLLGRERTQAARRSCFVIVELESDGSRHPLGILVDAVEEVIAVEESRIEKRAGLGARSDIVSGVLNLESHFIVTLDILHLLSSEELLSLVGPSGASSP